MNEALKRLSLFKGSLKKIQGKFGMAVYNYFKGMFTMDI